MSRGLHRPFDIGRLGFSPRGAVGSERLRVWALMWARLVEVRPMGGMLVWSVGLKRNCCPPDPCEQMDFKKSYLNIF